MRKILRFLFQFSGRVTRRHYALGAVVVPVFVALIILTAGYLSFEALSTYRAAQVVAVIFGFILFTSLYLSNAAFTARRLHDLNYSGLWAIALLFFNAISTILLFLAMA